MRKVLLVLTQPAYGADGTFNAMRLANALDRMLRTIARHGGHLACCGTCLDARGLTKEHLIAEAPRSTIEELAAWTVEADQVLTF